MEAIIGDTFAKNAETGTSRSCSFDSFDEDINIHSVHQLCNDSRKKAIHQYIEDSVGGFKYDDSMLIPQISYNKLENVRFNIDKFYNDKLDFIEYGSSSFNTSHYLYRHSDGNVYNVITTRRHTPVIIYDETNNLILEFNSSDITQNDAGLSQITKIISLDTNASEKLDIKKSEIVSREVYVKISKGTKMVRKFMVWKTNKEATGEYQAYVYHYTDFSAGRAEMLKKEIKVSDSKKQIEDIFAAEVLENVKKGWEKV